MDFLDILRTLCNVVVLPLMLLAGQRWLNAQFDKTAKKEAEKAEAQKVRHDEEKAWRESVDERMTDLESKTTLMLSVNASNTRADIIHKAHRYVDDLGKASTEEKESFHKQYEDYCAFCDAAGIQNDFIDSLVEQVMNLPNR